MATDRQLRILHHLSARDQMEVQELAQLLHVSTSTIRRELTALEDNGLLVRTHGAARLAEPIRYEAPYENRASQRLAEKRAIALAAKEIVTPGMVIGLMGGTTCTELARVLRPVEPLTIVTNAVNVVLELQATQQKRVMVTGGVLNQNSYELVGSQVLQALQTVHLDLAFIGVSGISAEYGFSMSDEPEATVGHGFSQAADRTVVIADHSKVGNTTFARLCPLRELDLLITDNGIAAKQLDDLRQAGLEVMIANPVS